MIRTMTLVIALAAAACGGSKAAPATSTTTQPSAGPEAHEGMEHEGMSAEMKTFHDVLAPRWHAEHGPQRMQDTCTAVPEFQADADAIAKATPPDSANADTWTASTRALVDAINTLDATCKANDTAKFEEAFHGVHESFHGIMAAAGMMKEGGTGEHEHQM